jgi:nucleoside-diphosphate-sugar epimerase
VYTGQSESPWHERLALPDADLPHLIVAFKKAVEPLTTHALQGSGVQPVILRIGSTWGPLMDPESPFNFIPPYVSALQRGEQPAPLRAEEGGDSCYAVDAGRAIALLTTTETLNHTTYNVSSGRPTMHREFAEALRVGTVPGGQLTPYLDIGRLTEDTGFVPEYDAAAAVAHYVAWRSENAR